MKKRDCCEIILNHACDLRCAFCSQADFDPAALMPAAEAVRQIYRAKKAGFGRLGFSGGEALLRRDLPALVKAARSVGFKAVRLQTNGTRLASRAAAEKLVKAGLTVCKFTFASHVPAVHDRLVGREGAFKKSLAGLGNMLRLKAAVGVNLLVTRDNFRTLPETLKFFMDRGAAAFVIIYPIQTGAMARAPRLRVSLPEAAGPITEALRLAALAGLGKEVKALNIPPCLLPGFESRAAGLYRFDTVVIGADGAARDLDETVAASKRRAPFCARCFFSGSCRGVDAGYVRLFGWKGFRPVRARPEPFRPAAGPYLSNSEKCFLETLRSGGELSTAAVLRAAKGVPLCYDCTDGTRALAAGQSLEKKGLVSRALKGGLYYWRLRNA